MENGERGFCEKVLGSSRLARLLLYKVTSTYLNDLS